MNIETQNIYSIEAGLEMIQALADRTRQEIIMLFTEQKEVNVTEISRHFVLSRPTISHHLNLMKRVKLLNARKDGKEIYYSFNKQYVTGVLQEYLDHLRTCC